MSSHLQIPAPLPKADNYASSPLTSARVVRVVRVSAKGVNKHLQLETGASTPALPRSACAAVGDYVSSEPQDSTQNGQEQRWSVHCHNGTATLWPHYNAADAIGIGDYTLNLRVGEIGGEDDFRAYQNLADLHYRGHALHGRTAKLLARSTFKTEGDKTEGERPSFPARMGWPEAVGYIELATPFYMSKPRAQLFDAPFAAGGYAWESWDKNAQRKHVSLCVRVARCVVLPEFRGLGLGQLLLRHGLDFARTRWQSGGHKPLFVEIAADMLKFVPFAERTGMVYIGDTQGNLGRVMRDMGYLLANQERVRAGEIVREEACGIVDQQVARMTYARRLMQDQNWTREELLKRLQVVTQALQDDDENRQLPLDFMAFQPLLSLPKPMFMMGLTDEVQNWVVMRTQQLGISPKNPATPRATNPATSATVATPRGRTRDIAVLDSDVELRDLNLQFHGRVQRTRSTHALSQAFGIAPDAFTQDVVRGLSLRLSAGQICLLTGPSGSGKTSLLRFLRRTKNQLHQSGEVIWPANYRAATLAPLKGNRPIIENMIELVQKHCKPTPCGVEAQVNAALQLMGVAGLSDAFAPFKRFGELSTGQQHRAMLAALLASNANVWLLDEFCCSLDLPTANALAARLMRLVKERDILLVVASGQPQGWIASLRPDVVVGFDTLHHHQVWSGREWLGEK